MAGEAGAGVARAREHEHGYADPPDEAYGENPAGGAPIDYFLAGHADQVKIEILESAGKVVRSYASDGPPEITQAAIEEPGIPTSGWRGRGSLPAKPGSTAGAGICTTPRRK
jgi:hypothetical protein